MKSHHWLLLGIVLATAFYLYTNSGANPANQS
jgi:hypothetical protein